MPNTGKQPKHVVHAAPAQCLHQQAAVLHIDFMVGIPAPDIRRRKVRGYMVFYTRQLHQIGRRMRSKQILPALLVPVGTHRDNRITQHQHSGLRQTIVRAAHFMRGKAGSQMTSGR